MSNESADKDVSTLQICTYVFRIENDDEDRDDSDEIRNELQTLLGPDHEVISSSKMKFSSQCTDNSSFLQHVVKIKTNAPSHVAAKFGSDWVREDYILFKSIIPFPRATISNKNYLKGG